MINTEEWDLFMSARILMADIPEAVAPVLVPAPVPVPEEAGQDVPERIFTEQNLRRKR